MRKRIGCLFGLALAAACASQGPAHDTPPDHVALVVTRVTPRPGTPAGAPLLYVEARFAGPQGRGVGVPSFYVHVDEPADAALDGNVAKLFVGEKGATGPAVTDGVRLHFLGRAAGPGQLGVAVTAECIEAGAVTRHVERDLVVAENTPTTLPLEAR